ncbi:hypothetical protein PMIN01_10812 [Paraphaeosphaeria minitans]|uniref:Uncharacterized protein n=1 Tax=Paraphaeosphaeria minitans TaxID=565426 RepID=A0A9P6KLU6_9PLEO|nr:hypothetical protein PMIN01_10812 [Paraphaeosphaeria minitans]
MAAKSKKAPNPGKSGKSGKTSSGSTKTSNEAKVCKSKRAGKASKASDSEAQSHTRATNDCFGPTSPHWNLPFHLGNATAAELISYLPHSLKCVDVIDRFVMNGGKAWALAFMLNKYRVIPARDGSSITANSICIMLQCAMRNYGLKKWTAGKHVHSYVHTTQHNPDSLDVSSFRVPWVTHPKVGKCRENFNAGPIEFRDLARSVKLHPSGEDALDLTRCVLHAVNHPNESWLFPDDFVNLVNHLGGAQAPTRSQRDEQAFDRHQAEADTIAAAARPPAAPTAPAAPIAPDTPVVQYPHLGTANTTGSTRDSDMRLAAPKKRSYAEFSAPRSNTAASREKGRSGRLATQAVNYLQESDSDIDASSKNDTVYEPPTKKRRSARASSAESKFTGNGTSGLESLGDVTGETSDGFVAPNPKRPVRASALKGRILTQKAVHKETPKTPHADKATRAFIPIGYATLMSGPTTATGPTVPDYLVDPALLGNTYGDPVPVQEAHIDPVVFVQMRALEARAPVQVKAPILDCDRIVANDRNVWAYADDGCVTREEMFASAFSYQRFDGARAQAPFRELHRLSDPDPRDMSDWAENIRWAKEQWLYYTIGTWTEFGGHLEQITQWRHDHGWWSDAAIAGGFDH